MSSDDELSSELSSVPSEDETLQLKKKNGILKFFSKAPPPSKAPKVEASPPRPKREPSPPHEYVLADNPDIAFIVMFRSRFTEAFPKSLTNIGPQELERDIVANPPGEGVEHFLCALLGLLLNRKQDVKAGHYERALGEAIQAHKTQWAKDWESKNPVSGGATFGTMTPVERLTLLRTLIHWSLSSSEVVKGIIQTSYKQSRHDDDLNQPLSVQPWGSDADKRKYYLIEGLDDTNFRIYRESNHLTKNRTWFSVAGSIDELKALAEKLNTQDGGQKARTLSAKMMAAIPRFEATEEKRKRREYRAIRKQQFKRPDPGFSMYEGRTRGKRMKYNFSDDEEDIYSDATSTRRSTRNTGTHTPAEPAGPVMTQSGRQVKARQGGAYGESMLTGQAAAGEETSGSAGDDVGARPRRAAATNSSRNGYSEKSGRHIEGYNDVDEMTSDDEDDASEQDYGDDEEEEDIPLESDHDEQDEPSDEDDEMLLEGEKKSLIIKLPIKTPTPERKPMIKLRLSPNKDSSKSPGPLSAAGTNVEAPGIEKENNKPAADDQVMTGTSDASAPSKPITIPPPSPARHPQSPLAFRGSPEKPQTLPQTVALGYGAP